MIRSQVVLWFSSILWLWLLLLYLYLYFFYLPWVLKVTRGLKAKHEMLKLL